MVGLEISAQKVKTAQVFYITPGKTQTDCLNFKSFFHTESEREGNFSTQRLQIGIVIKNDDGSVKKPFYCCTSVICFHASTGGKGPKTV